jgi:hypothetical protein
MDTAGHGLSAKAGGRGAGGFARRALLALGMLLGSSGFDLWGKAPALVELRVFPAEVNLSSRDDFQSVVVQAVYADGVTRDVSAKASISVGDKRTVAWQAPRLTPVADGSTELRVKFDGKSVVVPIKVARAKEAEVVSFTKDVMPVLTKTGCNTGGCHGASRGKDGFHLSLFGYDPDDDHHRLTREAIGRRINLALPEESLLLEKAINRVPHTGGERFKVDSVAYRTLLAWLKAGAPKDTANVAKVVRLEANPRESVLAGVGQTQQLNVRAFYSDGTDRDVTDLAVYIGNNDPAVKVSEAGRLSAVSRGEAFVTVRFEGMATGVDVLSIPADLAFKWPEVPEVNYIDALVNAKLRKLRITPSALSDDATFLRRAYLDLAGLLPSSATVRAFVADSSPGKRAALIDSLIARPEFTAVWTMKWAEMLQIRSADQQVQMSLKSAQQYYEWLEDQMERHVPADEMVRALLIATGPSFERPEANYYKVERDTLKLAENTAQAFMGLRIQCAQCHNHPFDRWSMNDYYGFAAFFAQIGRKSGEDPRETIITNSGSGGVKHPVGGKDVAPRFLGGAQPEIPKGGDRRRVLAEWLTSPDNPYFSRNLANVVWAQFFGRGIVDPVDDVRVSNPAANAALLDRLAAKLVEYKYDIRPLVRDICNSRTYQLSALPNESNADDDRNFARAGLRRIRAEVLLDALNELTGSVQKIQGLRSGARTVAIADGRTTNYFLTTFGRATRETPCTCEVRMEPNLSQALHLLNGDSVNAKVVGGGVVKKLLKEGRSPAEVTEELYLRTLGRFPLDAEKVKLQAFFGDGKAPDVVLNDLFWSLLNAKEFVFNH